MTERKRKIKFNPQSPKRDSCVKDGYYTGEKHLLHQILKDGMLTEKCLNCSYSSCRFPLFTKNLFIKGVNNGVWIEQIK